MTLTSNAKATIAYTLALTILMAYDVASFQANGLVWGPAVGGLPVLGPLLVNLSTTLVGLILPIFVLFAGISVLWIWEGNRSGYTVALILAIVAILLNLAFGIGLVSGGLVLEAGICLVNIVLGLLAARAASRGLGEAAPAAAGAPA